MLFKDVIGQQDAIDGFRQMAQHNRLPHALLLLGPEGSGKLNVALALAQYILCSNRTSEDACGVCPSCIKASKLVHPDLHFSFPTVGTNVTSDKYLKNWREALAANPYMNVQQWLQLIGAENKQGNINKEECLQIIRKLSLKTFEGSNKVLVMWLPEFLGKEGNRLLKIIEEPPEGTTFILVAEQTERILNTILSRCQLVKIPGLQDEQIEAHLVQHHQLEKERASSIAYLANGNFNEALLLMSQKANDNASLFLDWLRKCYVGKSVELVEWVDAFAQIGRENQKYFIQYGLHFLREFLGIKLGIAQSRLQPAELKTANNLVKILEFDQVEALANLFSELAYAIERNANPKILMLDASIQVHKMIKRKHPALVAGA